MPVAASMTGCLSFWNGIYHGDRRMGDGAYNPRTDIETSPLDPELHDGFTSMLTWESRNRRRCYTRPQS